ncbi:MAG: nicotinamide riboside transporter PnuC [Bacteroidales bacterium]|nr:nicotinamide riboside transporter PnuC [Bacteroidales bacterium]MDD2425782.1 nicotinamide riboside transporter PnuC [Bacteroidales bacterium]MDD3990106.1 nicotinamide riboside transporter PnuC [Bacteroidales bacterium]MDD4638699.1 nicotinamide riboside transporter PnuC [Bacteroidales bacterium]
MADLFSIENTLFTLGNQSVSLLEFIAVLSGLTCVYLATRAKVANFWVGYLYNILLFILFYQKGLYSSMLVQPVSFIINFFGHYRWTHPAKGEENRKRQLKITLLSNQKRVRYILQLFVLAALWGTVLTYLDNLWPEVFSEARRPYLDAFVTITILTAQYLSAQKKLDCWAAWFTVNITNIILYILAGLVFMPLVSAGYLILAIFGFAMWRKEMNNE